MPKIRLKPNSAEYDDEDDKSIPHERACDMPGCGHAADYKAPKDRELNSDYYWFCLEHIQDYNKAWDFFSGMSRREIEEHIIRSQLWDRPTKKYDRADMEENLRRKAWNTYSYQEEERTSEEKKNEGEKRRTHYIDTSTPEYEAMMIMGLEPPLSLKKIKEQYKKLAKKYHPDLNRGDKTCEELLKSVNMAYTILKLAYEQFEELDQNF